MKITLLGTGGPRPDPERLGSSLAVEVGEERLLFDCGRGAVIQLVRAGMSLQDLNPVFITHHHYDHISDLGDLILSTWLQGRPGALKIYGPRGTAEIVTALIERVYPKDIRFRAEGEPAVGGWKPVDVTEVRAGTVHDGGHWKVYAEHVEHGQGLGIPDFDWVTLGYRLEADGKAVAISGDAVPCEGLDRLARGADVLVQCCYLAAAEVTDAHTERLTRHLFPSSTQVGKIAKRAGVKKLVLTHFRQKPESLMREIANDVQRDFGGEVILGRDLLDIEV
ncbi:MAG: MBL fold metallo-hydrolase [Nitrospinota bacterium]|jgi:ribonuclease Z|nr:MBL fold metallo-hydrolase [Nitrospinota bacterium]HJM41980.1 MBL fold metallo-hydrolase [Nitrospinota bacterium]